MNRIVLGLVCMLVVMVLMCVYYLNKNDKEEMIAQDNENTIVQEDSEDVADINADIN